MPESPRTIALVACASRKLRHAAPARDLYVSDLFAKSRRYAERHSAAWFILSALHGLVDPDVVIEPYDQTLNDMPVAQRRAWARRVLDQLEPVVRPGDSVIVLGGARYRDGIVPALRARGVHVAVPLEGLRIGEQLSFLANDGASSTCDVTDDGAVDEFYKVLRLIGERHGEGRLGDLVATRNLPGRGVYFFLDRSEPRSSMPGSPRVVRVGTHALKHGSASSLRGRLKQHFGHGDGGGNHRGSVFRLHVGAALAARYGVGPGSWGKGRAGSAAVRDVENEWEHRVTEYIRGLDVIVVGVPDEPGPDSDRAYVERNAIGLLSSLVRSVDPPSDDWLGRSSPREPIRASGLWNVNHVGERWDQGFLERLEALGRETSNAMLPDLRGAAQSVPALQRTSSTAPQRDREAGLLTSGDRPRALAFREMLARLTGDAENAGLDHVDVRSGDLHRAVGDYPGPRHAMATCCSVMRSAMQDGDTEVEGPPRGVGASLVIRYRFPR